MAFTIRLSTTVLALGCAMSVKSMIAQNVSNPSPVQQNPPQNTHDTQTPAGNLEPVKSKNYDPLLDLPPLPKKDVSLMGGTVTKLDRVRDQIGLRVFGGNETRIAFDVRTKFYQGSVEVKDRDLQAGQRIYVDTMLNGTQVFAKNIWIQNGTPSGRGTGQVLAYDEKRGVLKMRDELTDETLEFSLTPQTKIKEGTEFRSTNFLVPGSLVSLTFGPGLKEQRGAVQEVVVLARPGYTVSFFGTITFLDLSHNFIAVQNRTDGKTYDIQVDGISKDVIRQLHPGSVIGVAAVFDGKAYMARSVGIAPVGNTPQ
ncbi:MAG TPA: hypothetical protein VGF44_02520 [Terriglobales bacterium]